MVTCAHLSTGGHCLAILHCNCPFAFFFPLTYPSNSHCIFLSLIISLTCNCPFSFLLFILFSRQIDCLCRVVFVYPPKVKMNDGVEMSADQWWIRVPNQWPDWLAALSPSLPFASVSLITLSNSPTEDCLD